MENKSSDQANDAQSRTTSKSIIELVKSIFSTKELRTVDDYIVQQDRSKFVNLVSLCTALGLLMGATNGYKEGVERGQDALSKLVVDPASKEAQRVYHNQVYGRLFIQGATGGFKLALFATAFGGGKLYLQNLRQKRDALNSIGSASVAGLLITIPLGIRAGLFGLGTASVLGAVDGVLENYVLKKSPEDYLKGFERALARQNAEKAKQTADRPAEKMDTELEMHKKFMQQSSTDNNKK
jgi:hypothetical protein